MKPAVLALGAFLAVSAALAASPGEKPRPPKGARTSATKYAERNPTELTLLRERGGVWMSREGTGTRGGGDASLMNSKTRAMRIELEREAFLDAFAATDWIAASASRADRAFLLERLLPANPVGSVRAIKIDFREACLGEDGRRYDYLYVDDGSAVCVDARLSAESFPALWRQVFALRFPGSEAAAETSAPPSAASADPVQEKLRRGFNVSLPGGEARPIECAAYDVNMVPIAVPMDRLNEGVEFRRHPDGRWFARGGATYALCR